MLIDPSASGAAAAAAGPLMFVLNALAGVFSAVASAVAAPRLVADEPG